MKKAHLWFLALILTSALLTPMALQSADTKDVAAANAAANAVLSAEERAAALARLQESREDLLRQVAALSDAAWKFKAAPDRWSVAEVVEHLVLVEGSLRQRIDGALGGQADPAWAQKTQGRMEMILAAVPDRSQRAEAPEPLRPGGEGTADMSRSELVEKFLAGRAETITFTRETTAPLKAHLIEGGPFGVMSAHHWLTIIGLHNLRHNKQVAEILADPNLPR